MTLHLCCKTASWMATLMLTVAQVSLGITKLHIGNLCCAVDLFHKSSLQVLLSCTSQIASHLSSRGGHSCKLQINLQIIQGLCILVHRLLVWCLP